MATFPDHLINLASTAALTPNDPAFQPGFEHVDTSVTAAISLYGYYGWHPRQDTLVTPGVPQGGCTAVLRGAR